MEKQKIWKKQFFGVIFFCFLIVFSTINAFENNFKILEETPTSLRILYKNQLTQVDTIYIGSQMFLKPILPNTFPIEAQPSTPSTLVSTVPIALPSPNGYTIKSVHFNKTILLEGKIIPVAEKSINGTIYSYIPSNYERKLNPDSIKINYLGIARNLHIGQLIVPVAQYLSDQNRIQIITEAIIEIEFSAGFENSTAEESVVRVLNPNQAKHWLLESFPKHETLPSKIKDQPLVTNDKLVKIKVEREGIYKIDAGMLASLGISISQSEIPTIKLFGGNGKPLSELPTDAMKYDYGDIPIIIATKSNGDLDYILFYGVGTNGFEFNGKEFQYYSNPYGNTNYYYLAWGGTLGRRIIIDTVATCMDPTIQTTYIERIAYKEEFTNPFSSGSGRIWFGGSIFPRTFTNLLDNLDRTKSIFYRFYVAQKYQDSTKFKGTFSFYESSNLLGQVRIYASFPGSYEEARASFFQTQFDANKISSDNRSYLKIEYSSDQPSKSTPFFNLYEIHYSRQLVAKDNTLAFFVDPDLSGCQIFQIVNFSGEPIGLDVTDPRMPILLQNQSPIAGAFFIQTNLSTNSQKQVKRFIVASQFLKPEISIINYENLKEKKFDADVIVITHSSLVNSASQYIKYRSAKTNLKFALVTVDNIFEEFSFGIPDPLAIRYFLAYLMKTQDIKPKYVLLWGDGHFDYKKITTNQTNFIPPYESLDSYTNFNSTVNFTSDDFFAYIVGDDNVLDLSIARVPVASDQVGLKYLSKIQDYENQSDDGNWRTTVLLSADDSPANINDKQYDGSIHTNVSEILSRNFIPPEIHQKKIYLVEYPAERIQSGRRKPIATMDLVNTINQGVLLVNWSGHGNPRVWAHEELFDRDKTISQLTNINKLFFGIAATCDFGRFDMINVSSGAEELIFSPKGGAIGFFTATRAVYVGENSAINQAFLESLFKRNNKGEYNNLGDIYFNLKTIRYNSNDIKYQLYADPLLKLNLPEALVTLDRVNGFVLDSVKNFISIKAMSRLELEGSILTPLDSTLLTDFNGNIEIVINDVSYIKNVYDVDNSLHSILKEGGIISRGTFPVQNGKFKAEFIIPEELSFLDGTISIRFFAKDTSSKTFAKGYYNKVRVDGIDSVLTVDFTPPKINIYLNDTTFKENDFVSNPPLLIIYLWDDSGINTTGSGIGHRIECWIDDKPEPIDLTDKYESSSNDPKTGIIKAMIYGLESGEHIARVRAWDIFNNYSIAETKFRILDESKGIYLFNVSSYPDPAKNHLTFRFQHNLQGIFRFQIDVFTTYGSLVYSIAQETNKLLTVEFPWDLTDGLGNQLPSGIYLYKISVFTNDNYSVGYGKFAIIK